MTFPLIDFTTWADVPNPSNYPASMIVDAKAIADEKEPDTFAVNHRMTMADYDAYNQKHRDEWLAWSREQEAADALMAESVTRATQAKLILSEPESDTDHALTGLVKALVDQFNELRDAVGLKPVTIETLTAAVGEKIDSAAVAVADPTP
jgi:hypothetical protein